MRLRVVCMCVCVFGMAIGWRSGYPPLYSYLLLLVAAFRFRWSEGVLLWKASRHKSAGGSIDVAMMFRASNNVTCERMVDTECEHA